MAMGWVEKYNIVIYNELSNVNLYNNEDFEKSPFFPLTDPAFPLSGGESPARPPPSPAKTTTATT